MATIKIPGIGTTDGVPVAGLEDSGGRQRKIDERTRDDIEGRLTRIEGQIRGIRNMNSEGRLCVDIVTQIAAVRAALKKVADLLVAEHVQEWLENASRSPDGQGPQEVSELLKVFSQYYR